jgi:protein TonB
MEANQILATDILDILFEGRNKSYGAYVLRKGYNKRLYSSLGITALILLIGMSSFLHKALKDSQNVQYYLL